MEQNKPTYKKHSWIRPASTSLNFKEEYILKSGQINLKKWLFPVYEAVSGKKVKSNSISFWRWSNIEPMVHAISNYLESIPEVYLNGEGPFVDEVTGVLYFKTETISGETYACLLNYHEFKIPNQIKREWKVFISAVYCYLVYRTHLHSIKNLQNQLMFTEIEEGVTTMAEMTDRDNDPYYQRIVVVEKDLHQKVADIIDNTYNDPDFNSLSFENKLKSSMKYMIEYFEYDLKLPKRKKLIELIKGFQEFWEKNDLSKSLHYELADGYSINPDVKLCLTFEDNYYNLLEVLQFMDMEAGTNILYPEKMYGIDKNLQIYESIYNRRFYELTLLIDKLNEITEPKGKNSSKSIIHRLKRAVG